MSAAPLEEARALEGIGHCHLQLGNARQATPFLTQANAIYQRIGAPAAQRIEGIIKGQADTTGQAAWCWQAIVRLG